MEKKNVKQASLVERGEEENERYLVCALKKKKGIWYVHRFSFMASIASPFCQELWDSDFMRTQVTHVPKPLFEDWSTEPCGWELLVLSHCPRLCERIGFSIVSNNH